ncbi:GDSL esterase/lipase At5g03610-like [Coffea eugenioides]|uniref:GDSL esterase/lipase At5g03610-like n=1 Tax=Coffea eugenioides TaxID=49369 RepID=UPI000F60ED8F|nr:GDSL esterase/lipase At5g03610-like [Coffea eugenioides]
MKVQLFFLSATLIYGTFSEFDIYHILQENLVLKVHYRKKSSRKNNYGIEKLFVIGDSYADTGNLPKMWKDKPYGLTFPGKPDGRFSDGHILTDFIADFLGLKSPVPYRMRNAQKKDLQYGINFAFGGAGVGKTLSSVPNFSTQVDFFEELIKKAVYSKCDLEHSLTLVTLSGNDYSAFLARGGTILDLIITFIPGVVQKLAAILKRISDLGVKRIAVGSLPPLGCVPVITISSGFKQCNYTANMASILHNSILADSVAQLNNESLSTQFEILDLDAAFTTIIQHVQDRKEAPLTPCCQGIANYSCGDVDSNGKQMYTVCRKPKHAFFWDNAHPTQAGWHAVFSVLKPTIKDLCEFS